MCRSDPRRPTVHDICRSVVRAHSDSAHIHASRHRCEECMWLLFAHVTLKVGYFCCLGLVFETVALTKLIRAIRILPLVFQLMVHDTRNISENSVSMAEMKIGTNVNDIKVRA